MHGFIPTSFKSAAITPVFKSGIKTSPCNYRPISLTSTIIKVFERIVRKQVVAFLTRRGHLNNTQHGFRSGRSCLSALLGVFALNSFKNRLHKVWTSYRYKTDIRFPLPPDNKLSLNDITSDDNQDQLTGLLT